MWSIKEQTVTVGATRYEFKRTHTGIPVLLVRTTGAIPDLAISFIPEGEAMSIRAASAKPEVESAGESEK